MLLSALPNEALGNIFSQLLFGLDTGTYTRSHRDLIHVSLCCWQFHDLAQPYLVFLLRPDKHTGRGCLYSYDYRQASAIATRQAYRSLRNQ